MNSENQLSPDLLVEYIESNVVSSLKRGDVIPILTETLVIGKADVNDLHIQHTEISRQHARLTCEADKYFIEDLYSTNGTYVNDKRLEPNVLHPLNNGDAINLANVIAFQFSDPFMTHKGNSFNSTLSKGLQIFPNTQDVYIEYQKLEPRLTTSQFLFLQILVQENGNIIDRDEIVESVWPEYAEEGVTENMIDSLVAKTRRKLSKLSSHEYIVTVRGRGFRFEQLT